MKATRQILIGLLLLIVQSTLFTTVARAFPPIVKCSDQHCVGIKPIGAPSEHATLLSENRINEYQSADIKNLALHTKHKAGW